MIWRSSSPQVSLILLTACSGANHASRDKLLSGLPIAESAWGHRDLLLFVRNPSILSSEFLLRSAHLNPESRPPDAESLRSLEAAVSDSCIQVQGRFRELIEAEERGLAILMRQPDKRLSEFRLPEDLKSELARAQFEVADYELLNESQKLKIRREAWRSAQSILLFEERNGDIVGVSAQALRIHTVDVRSRYTEACLALLDAAFEWSMTMGWSDKDELIYARHLARLWIYEFAGKMH